MKLEHASLQKVISDLRKDVSRSSIGSHEVRFSPVSSAFDMLLQGQCVYGGLCPRSLHHHQ